MRDTLNLKAGFDVSFYPLEDGDTILGESGTLVRIDPRPFYGAENARPLAFASMEEALQEMRWWESAATTMIHTLTSDLREFDEKERTQGQDYTRQKVMAESERELYRAQRRAVKEAIAVIEARKKTLEERTR